MIRYTQSVAPTQEPVTVAEIKHDRRITTTDDDDYLDSLITAARLYVESYTGRALVSATHIGYMDHFPSTGIITLDYPPLSSVTSLQYVDGDGATQTFSSGNYTVDASGVKGRITLNYGQSWPEYRAQHNAITITFVAGYGQALQVPQDIKQALRMLIGHWYENREATTGLPSSVLPIGLQSILDQLKVWQLY